MGAIHRLLVAPASLCLKSPRLAAAVIALLLAAVAAFSHTLRFDDKVARAFSSHSPISRAYEDFLDALGSPSQFIIVLAEADSELDSAAIEALRTLALEFELDDDAELVMSPFSVRFPRDGGAYAGEALVPADPQPDAIRQRLAAYEARGLPINPLITPDLRSAVLTVAMNDSGDVAGHAAQVARVKSIMAAVDVPGFALTVTGEAAISLAIAQGLSSDLIVLNLLGAALGVVAAWLIFRSGRAMVCVVAPAIAGTAGALGVFVATGLPVT
ncbi:MAG: MMPL family transporter, partial [Brucellaceae bacterium]|nr:MMPL family transporter [Brucellaceae bacterium]